MAGQSVGTKVESNHPAYAAGGLMFSFFGMCNHKITNGISTLIDL